MTTLLKTKRYGWALICVVVTAVAFLSHFSGKRYLAAVAAVERTLAVEMAIDGVLSLLKDGETGQRGFVLTGDEAFLEPYAAEQNGIAAALALLREATQADPEQVQSLQAMERLIAGKHTYMARNIQMRRDGQIPAMIAMVRGGKGKAIMDEIRALCLHMGEHEQRVLLLRKTQAAHAQLTAAWGGGMGLLLTSLLALVSLLSVHRDVRRLKQTSEQLAVSEEHFRLLTEHGSDLIRLINLQGGSDYVSPSVERLLGYGVEEFLALPALALIHPEELAFAQRIRSDANLGIAPPEVLTYRLRQKSGEYRCFETRWTVRRDASGAIAELQTASRDVTDRKRVDDQLSALAAELRSLSLRDELTGLYNRRGFSEIAGQTRNLAARDGRAAALIFVDLNGMKQINNEFGHEMGDAALLDTAMVLTAAHREADVVARLGGDEFAVFSLDFVPRDLEPLRRRLRLLCDGEAARSGRHFRLSMSTGAAFMEAGSRESLAELLERADAAMYAQKNARAAAGGVTLVPPSGVELLLEPPAFVAANLLPGSPSRS